MEKTAGGKDPESALISAQGKSSARDHFYEKLGKLNESSGLSFVFNFRETMLDLYHLYEQVIRRGGFYQVTKVRKWDDVASALNLRSSVNVPTAQLQSVYQTLLLQYELLYCRNISQEVKPWPEKNSLGLSSGASPSYSTGKRKYRDVNDINGKEDNTVDSGQMVSGHKKLHDSSTIIDFSNSNVKEFVEMLDAPLKPRTGYQIFLRLETQRLKKIHGESSSSCNLREIATRAWRSLTEEGKRPYVEASRMDKERYMKELAAYEKLQSNPGAESRSFVSNPTSTMISVAKAAETDDVYHVSSEADCDDLISPDESTVELAVEAMKNAQSNDPMFQIDWDCGSLEDMSYQTNDDKGTFCGGGA